ncbi:MAG: hypothetical protein SF028_11645 [Candidatus Sumerlaeia bacterium]|nr:hypothetical protein [Candidatus Sumerlaeia bacterium]
MGVDPKRTQNDGAAERRSTGSAGGDTNTVEVPGKPGVGGKSTPAYGPPKHQAESSNVDGQDTSSSDETQGPANAAIPSAETGAQPPTTGAI